MLWSGCVALAASIGAALHASNSAQDAVSSSDETAIATMGVAPSWSLDALLAQPEIASVLESGQSARVSLMFGESRLSAIVSRVTNDNGVALALGPIWVVSVEGLPAIEPSLRAASFAEVRPDAEPEIQKQASEVDETSPIRWLVTPVIAGEFPRAVGSAVGDDHPSAAQDRLANCPAPAIVGDPSFKFLLAWDDRTSARIHARAVEGLRIARALTELRASTEPGTVEQLGRAEDPEQTDVSGAQRQRWTARAEELLREPLPTMPPCGSPLISYIELVDAHQALLRSLGRIADADTLAKWMFGRLSNASLHAVAARLAERVPPLSSEFASCTFHPCWLTDTGEITAAAAAIVKEQRRFGDELLAATRRLEPCDERLIDALQRQCEWLVGRLPIGARVDESVVEMLRVELEHFCRGGRRAHPSLVQDCATTISLRAWSAAWTAPTAQDPTADELRRAWRAMIIATVGEALENGPLRSKIPPAEHGAVLAELAVVIDRVLSLRDEYLGAFPPGPKTVNMFGKHLGWIFSGRKYDSLGDNYGWYNELIADEAAGKEVDPLQLQSVLQNARRRVAYELASEATEALYMACAESGPDKDYPEPFPMRYAGFNGGVWRLKWEIGAD